MQCQPKPISSAARDRRFRYPPEVRLELLRLFSSGYSPRKASLGLGVPMSYAQTRFNAWRANRHETQPSPHVLEMIGKLVSAKDDSHD